MIAQETVDRIFQAANIVDIVGDYVTLRKKGVNYLGLCPFHEDKNPSFYVSPAKNICKCFSCGKGGNPVQFLMTHENLSYPEALRALGKKYGIEVENIPLSAEEKAKQHRRENLRNILNFTQKIFEKNLEESSKAQDYLKERFIFPRTYRKFNAGYAQSRQLPGVLSLHSFPLETACEAGVTGKNDAGACYDYFRERIIFPYYDLYGNIAGFTGRSLDPQEKIKYLNTPETPLFSKGRLLFGLYQARDAIRKSDHVYLAEGQFDVLSMVQAGFENTVACSTTSITGEQIKLLRRFTQNITLIFDNDGSPDPEKNPGLRASLKNGDLLLSAGMNVRVVPLPPGSDPDSYIRTGSDPGLLTDRSRHPDFIDFKYETLLAQYPEARPGERADIYKSIAGSIARIADRILRANTIAHLVERYRIDGELVKESVREHLAGNREKQEVKEAGFYGLEEAKELISRPGQALLLTGHIDRFAALFGEKPVVCYFGDAGYSKIQELIPVSTQIDFIDTVSGCIQQETLEESAQLLFLKNLHRAGFSIILSDTCNEDDEKNSLCYGFLDFYIISCGQLAEKWKTNVKNRSILIERAAEMLSCIPDSERNAGFKQYCGYLDITAKVMNDTLKPYLDKKKSRSRLQSENLSIDGETLTVDPNNIPDYVDEKFFRQYGFFPVETKTGRRISYMFREPSGALTRVGNFYLTPLFHVYEKTGVNKRVVRMDHMHLNYPVYAEWPSRDMINLNTFRQLIWDEGGFVFENGNKNHLDKILSSIAMQFRKCFELKVYGQQAEGFYAFSNAVYHIVEGKHRIDYVDEYGIVSHEDVHYYIPAFSKIYAGERRDSDQFLQDRYFVYREQEEAAGFADWASLMDEVYRQNDNGKWAILFAVMSAFRSVIYPIDRLFTSLFFVGPTESGKSQIAVSIRSLFIHPDAALFNLNSGTDPAFFTTMEKYRDVPVVFEEYNDHSISEIKFQGLKAAVYDGEGKQKRKDAASKELYTSQVNSVPVLLGQEAPQRDDSSLYNRSVICEVPKKDDWTDREREIFQRLKELEKRGLSPVLVEVLKIRPLVDRHFKSIQRACFKELKEDIRSTHSALEGQTRILNTVSLFLTMCRLLEEHAPQLKLPFTYREFFKISREKVIRQAENIARTNRLAVYFNSIVYLIEQGKLLYGRELKIGQPVKVKIMINRKETKDVVLPSPETRVLYLRISSIQPHYAGIHAPKDILTESSLAVNLSSHPSYIGPVKSARFKWNRVVEVPAGNGDLSMRKIVQPQEAITSAVALNYDLLKEMADIDLERFIHPEGEADNDPGEAEKGEPEEMKPVGELPF
jgi:DNA primase catalytic core